MITRSCNIFFNSLSDFQSFETWYSTQLGEGAAWFNYIDPIDGATKSARFVGGGYTATPLSLASGEWQVNAKIESWGY